MQRQGLAGKKGGPTPRGARRALMALRDLLGWQGQLIDEALRDLDEPGLASHEAAQPRRRQRAR